MNEPPPTQAELRAARAAVESAERAERILMTRAELAALEELGRLQEKLAALRGETP